MMMVLSGVMGTLGVFLILRGKKTRNVGMMMAGGLLLVLSYWLFA